MVPLITQKLVFAIWGLCWYNFLSFVGAERLECVEFKNAASLRKRMNLKRRCSVVVETDDLPLCFRELMNYDWFM